MARRPYQKQAEDAQALAVDLTGQLSERNSQLVEARSLLSLVRRDIQQYGNVQVEYIRRIDKLLESNPFEDDVTEWSARSRGPGSAV